MIDPTALPFLLKAVDFLFGEGSKILEDRRERRKSEKSVQTVTNSSTGLLVDTVPAIHSKDEALQQPLDEFMWQKYEDRVHHLMSLLDIYTRNYNLSKNQYSKWGSTMVPQIIMHNLTEAEDNIDKTVKELQQILSKVYGKSFVLPLNI